MSLPHSIEVIVQRGAPDLVWAIAHEACRLQREADAGITNVRPQFLAPLVVSSATTPAPLTDPASIALDNEVAAREQAGIRPKDYSGGEFDRMTQYRAQKESAVRAPDAPAAPDVAALIESDHKRGCEGRSYTCTCGYDDAVVAMLCRLSETDKGGAR